MNGEPRYRVKPAALLEIAGRDREAFLQGQCTNDVLRLEPGGVTRAAALTPKGKLLADFRIARLDPLRILTSPGRDGALAAHFRKYAVFQDVRIENLSSAFSLVEFYGGGEPLPEIPSGEILSSKFADRSVQVWPAFFETSSSWLVSREDAPSIETALSASGRKISAEEAEALRIEAGRPEYGRDMDDSHLPDEVGMDDAISTAKGCYVGQEIVARLRTYGRVNKRLVGWSFSEGWLPAPGTALFRPGRPEKELGKVTSSADSVRLGGIGLGYALRDVAEGEILVLRDDETKTARVEPKTRS